MRFVPFAVLWLLAASCASVPTRFSRGSAASPEASAAPVAEVTVALREDPPLPGAEATRWPGLGGEVPAMNHAHMGHGGAGMPMDHGAAPMDHSGMGGRPSAPPPPVEEERGEGGHGGH